MTILHPRKINKIEVYDPLKLNDSDLKRMMNTKPIGIIVDEGLNWERQYKTVYNNDRKGPQSLRRPKKYSPSILIKQCISSPN